MIPNQTAQAALTIVLLTAPACLPGAELSANTVSGWQDYIKAADARMDSRLAAGKTFLWIDEQQNCRKRVMRGEVVVQPMQGRGLLEIDGGAIHDWIGAEFIPNTTLARFLGLVSEFGRYKEFYAPAVVSSRCVSNTGEIEQYAMTLVHKLGFFDYVLDTQNQLQTIRVDSNRAYAFSQSNSIREIRDYGKPNQVELPADTGEGFVWRLHSIARYEQRDGGVYVEMEAIALSRDIPGSIRWLVGPMVTKASRNSLVLSLAQTRDALNGRGSMMAKVN